MSKVLRVVLGLWLLTQGDMVFGQAFIEPVSVPVTARHKSLTTDSVLSVQEIDFTGNGKPDILMKILVPRGAFNEHWLWWVRDDLTVYKKTEIGIADHEVQKFINLDEDPELEIINAWGYEDGINYSIDDLNYQSDGFLKNSVLFSPIVKHKSKTYWGYWRYWDALSFQLPDKLIEVLFDHDIRREGVVQIPGNFKMPVVFFNCENDSPSYSMNEVNGESEWITLADLFKRLKQ